MIKKLKSIIRKKIFNYKFFRTILFNTFDQYKKLRVFNELNLNANSIFIDIGTNEGLITHYINDKFKCKIICFEPHPGCYFYLKKLFEKKSNILIHNISVSNKSEVNGKLYLHKESKNSDEMLWAQGSSLEKNKTKEKCFELHAWPLSPAYLCCRIFQEQFPLTSSNSRTCPVLFLDFWQLFIASP
jgi:hypothetical protein